MENRMGFLVFGWVKESDTAARQRCFPISVEPQRPSGGDVWYAGLYFLSPIRGMFLEANCTRI